MRERSAVGSDTTSVPHPNAHMFLRPLAAHLFGRAVRLRNHLYDRGIIASERAPLPVISVGNLAVGGTGKTPLVACLAEWILDQGLAAGVLTRGYGRQDRRPFILPARSPLPPVSRIGDEPWLLSRRLPGLALGIDANRRRAARTLAPALRGGVLLLDDGFQHRRLRRDLDLVVLAAGEPLVGAPLLPAGRLREPASSLARADRAVVVAAPGQAPALGPTVDEVRAVVPALAVTTGEASVLGVRAFGGAETVLAPLSTVAGPAAAVAGIARPARLRHALEAAGVEVSASCAFPDHHRYRRRDWDTIAAVARRARIVITTEKDEPRLLDAFGPGLAQSLGCPVVVAVLEIRFHSGREDLRRAVLDLAEGRGQGELGSARRL